MPSAFVDLQVNGSGGVDFSEPTLTLDGIVSVLAMLRAKGTSAFCPTVVTTSANTYAHVLPILADACERYPQALLGIHLEGPFISPEDGAVGAHPKPHVQEPTPAAFDRLQELARGHVRILTLAPEVPGAIELTRHASASGVVVSIGHTLAGESSIDAATRAGARLSTHLGNGCPQSLHRHDNPIIAQLGSPLAAGIITDGHHLPPAFIRAVFAAKGLNKTVVVSDAAGIAGMPPGEYECFGSRVRIDPSGRIRNLDAPGLAGSSATMFDCMQHLSGLIPLDDQAAWALGRDNALGLLGLTAADIDDAHNVSFDHGTFRLV